MKVSANLWLHITLLGIVILLAIPASLPAVQGQPSDSTGLSAEDAAIRKCLGRMNEVMATKDLQKIMSIFEDSDEIMLVGSDSGEVFVGREQVKGFVKFLVGLPFIFSFEMKPLWINHDQNTAWVFVDGKMVHTKSNGQVSKFPYRITAVMVKKGDEWKWKVFSGSVPRGE